MQRSAPGTKGWDVDLAHGHEGENVLLGVLSGRVEVKRDRVAWRSERVAVEYAYKGKPSGIATTEAEWWAFVLDDERGEVGSVLLVPTQRLKRIAREAYSAGCSVKAGDGKASDVVLVPLSSLY